MIDSINKLQIIDDTPYCNTPVFQTVDKHRDDMANAKRSQSEQEPTKQSAMTEARGHIQPARNRGQV